VNANAEHREKDPQGAAVDPERARLSLEISAFGKGCRGNYTKYGFVLPLREKESISPSHFPGRFGKVQEFLARILLFLRVATFFCVSWLDSLKYCAWLKNYSLFLPIGLDCRGHTNRKTGFAFILGFVANLTGYLTNTVNMLDSESEL
jgi:hypothetical protein